MSRPPWCPLCERNPGMVHPHEFYDPETLAPISVSQAGADRRPVRAHRGRRDVVVRASLRRKVRRHVAA